MADEFVPCGRVTGHGEFCSPGRLCGPCREIHRLRSIVAAGEERVDEYPPCFYFAVGWTLAACCIMLDNGKDPREKEAPDLLQECIDSHKRAQEKNDG